MLRISVHTFTTLLLAVCIGVSVSPPAATATASQCPVGYFCVWTDSPFSGHFAYFAMGASNLTKFKDSIFNNKITDVWNRTANPFCLYNALDLRYGGDPRNTRRVIYPGFKGYLGTYNDVTSSLYRHPPACPDVK